MSEKEVGGVNYRIGKLDAFKQFHIARRLAPVLTSWAEVTKTQKAPEPGSEMDALKPIIDAVSKLSDADTDFVIHTCLAVVMRRDGERWANVRSSNGMLMYQDITMADMLILVYSVVEENLASFFGGGQSPSAI